MSEKGDAGKFQIENQEAVQGQVIGDYAIVHIHNTPASVSPSSATLVPDKIWNVPYPHNPFFTGREELLTQLATTLHAGQPTALSQPQAISGLGGIGKTQLALEYAYRYRGDYQVVLWAQADTRENLTSSYLTIATLLNLPEKSEQESTRVITAVKNWLQRHTNWLLILDNADDLALARGFLPPSFGGHVLLTTRAQATGRFAHRLEVDILSTELGALFLLRRASLLPANAILEQATADEQARAREMCKEVGGLPLALDQAGAYIEETGCSLADYQRLYQDRRADLLSERRGQLVDDHPLPVATTWSLSFAQVEQKSPAAADLLRLCAFLAPDAIPEEMITQGAEHLGPQLASVGADSYLLNQAIEALRAYSLLRRETSSGTAPSLSVHRLVQAVILDQMDEQDRKLWAQRAARAVNAAFPGVEYQTWPQCDRLLPHALLCAELIAQEQMTFLEATHLLNQTGYYLYERARYREAEPLIKHALVIRKQELGAIHPLVASSLNSLADLYFAQGKYLEVEPLYVQALDILRAVFGFEHPSTTYQLNGLANLYKHQGKYGKAEPLYMHILDIWKATYGPRHPNIASSLNNLAELHRAQGKYAEAEPLYLQALDIWEATVGSEHLNIAIVLNNLAALYKEQGRYAEVERLYLRVLSIWEATVGAEHPNVAASLTGLAMLYSDQEKYEDAEPLYQRALKIWKATVGPEHSSVAYPLLGLAVLYSRQGKYEDAEPLYQQAFAIREQRLEPDHPDTHIVRENYITLLRMRGRNAETKKLQENT